MKEMIAFCGLNCYECGAFIAKQNNDDKKRAEVAREWSDLFKEEIKPEDINCDGCRSEGGEHFSYCNVCEIRKCGMEKEVVNCGYCIDYPCERLDFIFNAAPDTKRRLDDINSKKMKVEVKEV